MMFRSKLLDLDFSPGAESLAVGLYTESDTPWEQLAFTTVQQTLKFYFQDAQTGKYRLHTGDIIRQGNTYSYRAGPAG
jgi:hypothetical protein